MSSTKDKAYKILKSPILTEKSTSVGAAGNGLVFKVSSKANKIEIKKAVESVFDVKVSQVRTANFAAKKRKRGELLSNRGSWKKAYVTLSEGNPLDIIESL